MGLFETGNEICVCCPVPHITAGKSNESSSFENKALFVFLLQGKFCQQIVQSCK
jgi:hypothetical protein